MRTAVAIDEIITDLKEAYQYNIAVGMYPYETGCRRIVERWIEEEVPLNLSRHV